MHLPHLRPFAKATVVFITTCTKGRQPLLAAPEVHATVRDIWMQSAPLNGWFVGHYMLMPDHVHLFACPSPDACALAAWMQLWKAISAKHLNRSWARTGPLWQSDYFDRFIRTLHDYSQKWDYVAMNPVRKGLVENPEAWPYHGIIHDLRYDGPRDW